MGRLECGTPSTQGLADWPSGYGHEEDVHVSKDSLGEPLAVLQSQNLAGPVASVASCWACRAPPWLEATLPRSRRDRRAISTGTGDQDPRNCEGESDEDDITGLGDRRHRGRVRSAILGARIPQTHPFSDLPLMLCGGESGPGRRRGRRGRPARGPQTRSGPGRPRGRPGRAAARRGGPRRSHILLNVSIKKFPRCAVGTPRRIRTARARTTPSPSRSAA